MPRGLTARIALAFVGVAIVTWLAIGGTLFIILRGLHAQTTGGRLEDQATALAVQARQAVNAGRRRDACSRRSGRRSRTPTCSPMSSPSTAASSASTPRRPCPPARS